MNVLAIVLFSFAGAALLLGLVVALLRQKMRALVARSEAEIIEEGRQVLFSPQPASFRGAQKKYGRLKCDGVIYLTTEEAVFHPLLGRNHLRLQLGEIVEAKLENTFLGERRPGRKFLVLELADGNEAGFFVKESEAWQTAVMKAARLGAGRNTT